MKKTNGKKPNIMSLISALCWVLAIMSVFTAFNEFQSIRKTKAYVAAAQKNKSVFSEIETVNSTQETMPQPSSVSEQGETPDFVNDSQEKTDGLQSTSNVKTYVINKNSKKIHSPDCEYVSNMKEENKLTVEIDNLEDYINRGYTICAKCGAK